MELNKKENIISMVFLILGTILSIVITIILFPHIHNSAIDINAKKDVAFLIYEIGLLLLFCGTFWKSTVRKFDEHQKPSFVDYPLMYWLFFIGSQIHPILAIVLGNYDNNGVVFDVIMWVVILISFVINLVFPHWKKRDLINKILVCILAVFSIYVIYKVYLVRSMRGFIYFLIPAYISYTLFYLFRKNIIKTKWNLYIWNALLIVSVLIMFLGYYFKVYLFY